MKSILPVVLVSLLVAGLSSTRADEPARIQILQLDLKVVEGAFSLTHFVIEPGELPEPDSIELTAGVVRYVVMDHSGRPMSEGLLSDPARVQRDSSDAERSPGPEAEPVGEVEVHLTLPYDRAMHQIHFAKIVSISDSAGVQMTRTESMGSVYVELHGDEE